MPDLVLSTYKILLCKALNHNIDEIWINWALDMMEIGIESDNLYILAGISKPYNQFELIELTKQVLKDLQLNYDDKKLVVKNYASYIIAKSVNQPDTYMETLQELRNIYIELGYAKEYFDFYLLSFAKEDLIESENQWYWNGANRNNIDNIIKEHFLSWKIA